MSFLLRVQINTRNHNPKREFADVHLAKERIAPNYSANKLLCQNQHGCRVLASEWMANEFCVQSQCSNFTPKGKRLDLPCWIHL